MKYVEVHVPYKSPNDVFRLYPFGDLHIGHINTHLGLIERTVEVIAKDRYARVIGMGDYGNAHIPGDKYFDFESLDLAHYPTPDLQYEACYKMFSKIKKKIDVLLTGNHDDGLSVRHGHNFVKDMAVPEKLDVPWAWTGAYIRYIFEHEELSWTYDVYASHGYAVEMRKQGSRVNRVLEMSSIFPHADLFLMGHVHALNSFKKTPLRMRQGGRIEEIVKYYVLTGGFLRGYVAGNPSYIERKMLEPQALGSPMISVKPHTREVIVREVFQGQVTI